MMITSGADDEGLEPGQQVETVAVGQVDIEKDHIERRGGGLLLAVMQVSCAHGLMAAALHQVGQGGAHQVVIIDDQDICHEESFRGG